MRCLLTSWSRKYQANNEGNYWRLLFSCMAMAVLVLLLAIKTSRHSSLRCLLTLCIVPMSPLWTIYNLFGPLKETLRGCRFTSGQQPREAGHAGQTKHFLCWKKCLEKQGDDVDKMMLLWCLHFYWSKIYNCTDNNYSHTHEIYIFFVISMQNGQTFWVIAMSLKCWLKY